MKWNLSLRTKVLSVAVLAFIAIMVSCQRSADPDEDLKNDPHTYPKATIELGKRGLKGFSFGSHMRVRNSGSIGESWTQTAVYAPGPGNTPTIGYDYTSPTGNYVKLRWAFPPETPATFKLSTDSTPGVRFVLEVDSEPASGAKKQEFNLGEKNWEIVIPME
jgi:hypothetical protein